MSAPSIDQAEADLLDLAERNEALLRHLALKRVDEEFRLTRFEAAAGVLVVIATIALSHVFPWGFA